MRRRMTMAWVVPALTALILALGCGEDSPEAPGESHEAPADAVPDFSLVDVNPSSPKADSAISPRDYREKISAWYFGHAT
ncbi:MAG: hypothetical protein GF355_10390 [Candidatus Eisenbacteria bacterium]|nr:hypothetical protein [Candidatus Eisenbacteria bacterium]